MRYTIRSNSAHAQMSHPKHGTVLVPLICLSITTHLFHRWTCLQYNDMWPTTPEKQNIRQWITKYVSIKCPTLDLLQHLQITSQLTLPMLYHDIFYICQFPLFVFSNIFHLLYTTISQFVIHWYNSSCSSCEWSSQTGVCFFYWMEMKWVELRYGRGAKKKWKN